MNKKYLIIGALLLVGGYIAYKKFYASSNDESDSIDTAEVPENKGIVPPVVVSESAPTLVVPSITTSTEMSKNKLVTKDNVATQSAPSSNFTYAGLGKY